MAITLFFDNQTLWSPKLKTDIKSDIPGKGLENKR